MSGSWSLDHCPALALIWIMIGCFSQNIICLSLIDFILALGTLRRESKLFLEWLVFQRQYRRLFFPWEIRIGSWLGELGEVAGVTWFKIDLQINPYIDTISVGPFEEKHPLYLEIMLITPLGKAL